MNSKEILQFCFNKGLLVDKDVLNLFSETSDTESVKLIINKIRNKTNKKVLTKQIFIENKEQVNEVFSELPKEKRKQLEKLKIKLGLSIEISKEFSKENSSGSELDKSKEISVQNKKNKEDNGDKEIIGKGIKVRFNPEVQSRELNVKDFVNYFKGRLKKMRGMIQEHSELKNLVSINKISGNRQGISIIGIVSSKRLTKNKNLLLEVEDLTGKMRVLINKNKPELFKEAEEIALDSVLGFKGSGNKEILFVNKIVFPDARLPNRKKAKKEELALFTGDLHVGSKLFLEENFLRFIDYLNGDVPDTPEASKIKYLFLVGDLIAGAGIYAGQENELEIPDVEEQYIKVAELLGKIRKDIKIIICPGNHDAMRIMEPQPVLDEKYAWAVHELDNVVLLGNPSTVSIGCTNDFSGIDVLMYHGYSFHYYADNINRLMLEEAKHKPRKIMKYLLKNRHLAPTHASTLYFPSKKDPHLIEDIPDIFVAGHTHKGDVSYYNNILVISSSTWEDKTAFQEKMGNEPDFCKVPMVNLKTREVKILDFEKN